MRNFSTVVLICLVLFCLSPKNAMCQLTIYSENFDGLTTGLISQNTPTGGWLASSTSGQLTDGCFNNDGFTCGCGFTYCVRNVWTIYSGGTAPLSAISGRSAGISGWDGNTLLGQFDYWVEAATTRWIKHSLVFSGYKDMNVSFKWKCLGESSGSSALDYGSVHLSTNNGSSWSTINTGGNGNSGKYYGLTATQNASIDLASSYDNASNVLLAFKWTCDDNAGGGGPTFIIDNILVTGCPLGGTISPLSTTFTTSGSTTLTCSGVVTGASYQWQSAPSATGPWTDITGATSATYTTQSLTTTTYFRCKVYSGSCDPSYQNSPAVVTITSGGCSPASILSDAGDVDVCENSSVIFEISAAGTAPVSYQWQRSTDAGLTWNNISGALSSDITIPAAFNLNGYLYRCIVSNACGIDTSDIAELTVYDAPGVFAGNDTLIEPGTAATLHADAYGGLPPYSYSWLPAGDLNTPDSLSTIATPSATTSYTVYATGANGCVGSDIVVVQVNSTIELFIPNVFTPNNDNFNDQFDITAEGVLQMNVSIFNRWGKEIISYDGMTSNWDGKTSSGVMADDGTYFYIVEATDLEGKKSYYQGSLTLFTK